MRRDPVQSFGKLRSARKLVARVALVALWLGAATAASAQDCAWQDGVYRDLPAVIVAEGATCTMEDLVDSQHVRRDAELFIVAQSIVARPGSVLDLSSDSRLRIRLLSGTDGYANIISEGGTLILRNADIRSQDPATDLPDTDMTDGRAFIRVDAFVDDSGIPRNGHIEIDTSTISHLGYDTRAGSAFFSGYGLSLKVRREDELDRVRVTGWIRGSELSHNYRGFYSYGARDIDFSNNVVVQNVDYGVDPHDESTGFIARDNLIARNGGTGLALSRRCSNGMIEGNTIIGNGANGVIIHDLSQSVVISNNFVAGNRGDGIVIHDSAGALVSGNILRDNRNGLRAFAGAAILDVRDNSFEGNRDAAILLLHGALEQADDLGDYTDGTAWNARNMSRHNDGRVWAVDIRGNRFDAGAIINAIEARGVRVEDNSFAGAAGFATENSTGVIVGTGQGGGASSYVLRRTDPEPVVYHLDPAPGDQLSLHAFDRVVLAGGQALIPGENPNFVLELSEADPPSIIAASTRGPLDVQSGRLALVPFTLQSGAVTVNSFLGDFARMDSARIELSSQNWAELALSADLPGCSLFQWRFETRFFDQATGPVIFSLPNESVPFSLLPSPIGSRVVFDLVCVD
jgi:parallel beta-helix repeat protein